MTIGERIKQARKSNGITQEELACEMNVTQATIGLWEKDKTAPTAYNLLGICNTLKCSADSLLGLSEDKKTK